MCGRIWRNPRRFREENCGCMSSRDITDLHSFWLMFHTRNVSQRSLSQKRWILRNIPLSTKHHICLTLLHVFSLFPRLKLPMHETHYETLEVIKEKWENVPKSIPSKAFAAVFDDWEKHWNMCIDQSLQSYHLVFFHTPSMGYIDCKNQSREKGTFCIRDKLIKNYRVQLPKTISGMTL